MRAAPATDFRLRLMFSDLYLRHREVVDLAALGARHFTLGQRRPADEAGLRRVDDESVGLLDEL
jgi:hypothetical protein